MKKRYTKILVVLLAISSFGYLFAFMNEGVNTPKSDSIPISAEEANLTWDQWTDASTGSSSTVFGYSQYDGQPNVLQLNHAGNTDSEQAKAVASFPSSKEKGTIDVDVTLASISGSCLTVFVSNAGGELLAGFQVYPDFIRLFNRQAYLSRSIDNAQAWHHFKVDFDGSAKNYDVYCDGTKIGSNLIYYNNYGEPDSIATKIVIYTAENAEMDYEAYANSVVLDSTSGSTNPPPSSTDPTLSPGPADNPINIILGFIGGIIVIGIIGFALKNKNKPPHNNSPQPRMTMKGYSAPRAPKPQNSELPTVIFAHSVIEKHIYHDGKPEGGDQTPSQGASSPKIRFCSECGQENKNDLKFCNYCGSNLL